MSDSIISFDTKGLTETANRIRTAFQDLPQRAQRDIEDSVNTGLVDLIRNTIADFTPVDTGALQRSTEVDVQTTEDGVTVAVHQPAENSQGVQYASFVILGHHTRSGSLVPPNPYPQEAWDQMGRDVYRTLREAAQKIVADSLTVMGAV